MVTESFSLAVRIGSHLMRHGQNVAFLGASDCGSTDWQEEAHDASHHKWTVVHGSVSLLHRRVLAKPSGQDKEKVRGTCHVSNSVQSLWFVTTVDFWAHESDCVGETATVLRRRQLRPGSSRTASRGGRSLTARRSRPATRRDDGAGAVQSWSCCVALCFQIQEVFMPVLD